MAYQKKEKNCKGGIKERLSKQGKPYTYAYMIFKERVVIEPDDMLTFFVGENSYRNKSEDATHYFNDYKIVKKPEGYNVDSTMQRAQDFVNANSAPPQSQMTEDDVPF